MSAPSSLRREELRNFYAEGDDRCPNNDRKRQDACSNPLDIDGPNFDSEAFLSKLLKEKSLKELMEQENDMFQKVRQLDSEMQSLVYENYAKFITATDTVRQMRTDFGKMEEEMDKLAQNMDRITNFSRKVCTSLQGRRDNIHKLVTANNTLKNVEYICDLPTRLASMMERKEYAAAVHAYNKAAPVLEEHKDLPAFQGIYSECCVLVAELKDLLKHDFKSRVTSAKHLSLTFGYLLELGEAPATLSEEFWRSAGLFLREDLKELENQVKLKEGPATTDSSAGSRASIVTNTSSSPADPVSLSSTTDLFLSSKPPPMSSSGVGYRPSDAIPSLPMDVLEFVDTASAGFLSNTSLVVATFMEILVAGGTSSNNNSLDAKRLPSPGEGTSLTPPASSSPSMSSARTPAAAVQVFWGDKAVPIRQVHKFITELMSEFFAIVERRFLAEDGTEDASLLIRAIDRLFRKLQALSKLVKESDFAESSLTIVTAVANRQIDMSLARLKHSFGLSLGEIRHALTAPRTLVQPVDSQNQPLAELLSKLGTSVVQNLKSAMANLHPFIDADTTFAIKKSFVGPFSANVRERLIVGYFLHIVQLCEEICAGHGDKAYVTPTVILLLSRFCLDLEKSTLGYLLDLCEQQFQISNSLRGVQFPANASAMERKRTPGHHGGKQHNSDSAIRKLTSLAELNSKMHENAQHLIDHYVEMEGFSMSQMLSKSVETRDWISCVEPRSVRAVMKRVVEDLSAMDSRVAQLFEEGSKRDRSSDSSHSRRTAGNQGSITRAMGSKLAAGGGTGGGQWLTISGQSDGENSLLKKLWSEKVDFFASVSFTKVSILTGVVKICLKTLLECVRLRTFGKFGLQQVQVDAHYLQLYLWRFVADENLVHHLLEEVMSSVALRCLEPTLMEPSVVEMICERG